MFITRSPENRPGSITAVAFIALLLAACSGGDNQMRSEQRGVDGFHSIDLRGASDANVVAGSATSVTITTHGGSPSDITTSVRNGVLVVDNKLRWGWFSRGKVDLRISTPVLNSLSLNGAGNVTVTGIQSGGLSLVMQGAGNLEAAGQTTALNARMNGAGNMNLERLIAGDATVAVNGAGNLSVHATGSLDATVNGVGSITYAGKPTKLDTQINGVGSISPATTP